MIDMTNKRYGKLTAVRPTSKSNSGSLIWEFKCDCGNTKQMDASNVRRGHTISCGCFKTGKVHGLKKSKIYSIWAGMKNRCKLDGSGHHRYGGRGIKVCDRWMVFENFYADMGHPPKGMQIDRIDNDGDYEPENCRWTTSKENSRNRECVRLNTEAVKVIKYAIKYMDVSKKRLAELHGVSVSHIYGIDRGQRWADVKI